MVTEVIENKHHNRAADVPPALSLITVVYWREIAQLRLQARSLAHFATALGLGEILILVNDVNEDEVAGQVEALRAEYGALAPLLRVVKGSELLGRLGNGSGLRYRLRRLLCSPFLSALRRRSGWQGHDGWQIQQAMKLLSGWIAGFPYVLMLDTKNILVAPVTMSDFISGDGRPRTCFEETGGELHQRWYPASAQVIGAGNRSIPKTTTHFTTPYCIARDHLNAVVARIEAQGWPVPALFCRPCNRVTEFMLISAYSQMQPSGLEGFFAPGILRSYTVFAGHSESLATAILDEALEHDGKMIGLHTLRTGDLTRQNRKQIETLVLRHGLFETPEEFWQILS